MKYGVPRPGPWRDVSLIVGPFRHLGVNVGNGTIEGQLGAALGKPFTPSISMICGLIENGNPFSATGGILGPGGRWPVF